LASVRQGIVFGDEQERQPVVAVAFPGRLRSVVEHVPEMPAAVRAVIFGARDNQLEIGRGANGSGQCLPETWPTGSAVIFVGAVEKGLLAGGADKDPGALLGV